ncbi:ArsR/SmtB family transcription factor [Streptomyces fuscigenes]|uniref:ArsR/SmtB family transcription factor n=1 Tax=Streptomyces fuscigenes TaxID=1528880 RepID=UPI001F31DE40|nr:metalloregulator ArsR/SmtB family transcription factor [Streptomyces fuscigenes]MCF3961644.1 metalloregulator ArsR/SmtB family transcription factor [Streptomyces fuscigenes]
MQDHSSPADAEIALPRLLGALSDPTRLGIVRVLADGAERGWGQLRAPVAKSTLSHHLKTLREAGVTRTRQEGTRCYVSLRREALDARFPGLLAALLAAAVADNVGEHVGEDPPAL